MTAASMPHEALAPQAGVEGANLSSQWPLGIPGWFGKLPGTGDFAQRRMPGPFVASWDGWLQQGLQGMRMRRPDWVERYREGAVWCFVLAAPLAGPSAWIGVLMPSVDAVGRYFPITLVTALPGPASDLQGDLLAAARRWWHLATQVALQGLDEDVDAAGFERLLHAAGNAGGMDAAGGPDLVPPRYGDSLWITDPYALSGIRLCVTGLPMNAGFDALFDIEPADGTV